MRTRVKFCGCTQPRDAMLAAECGADAVGFIFAPSARQIDVETAAAIARELPPFITPVGVFADPSLDEIRRAFDRVPNMMIQLHGNESPEFVESLKGADVIKVLHVAAGGQSGAALDAQANAFSTATLLFDTATAGKVGGTGMSFDWRLIAPLARERHVIVSGGLTPENVGTCVRSVLPYAVDVRSGVETDGRKDEFKMRAFVQAVRDADAA